jgi:thioredoxin 1
MPNTHSPRLLVACLCAQWCGTCREYQPLFNQLQAEFSNARFLWVDVEDEADLVDPIDVENFPTVLIARGAQPLFFGTITPHLETLRRLVQNHAQPTDSGPAALPQAIGALTQRLNRHA